jgi:hypothetical protein
MNIPDELIVQGVREAVAAWLAGGPAADRIAAKVAELHTELLTTAEAAALLRVAPKTLRKNAGKWGLRQSVAFGAGDPRFFRSQIVERAKERTVAA